MKRADLRRFLNISLYRVLLSVVLTMAVACPFARADTGQPAPQFTAQTLDGESFNTTSLRGRVVLLQFWATWCPHCRDDQSALDHIERMFSGQGLMVLAVDDGEPEATVMKYLQEHPRACRIVLDQGLNISRRFGKHGFPYYVLIDRDGRIAGTQNGAGGEALLLDLLSRAGLSSRSSAQQASHQDPDAASGPGGPSGAKVIEVPRMRNTRPAKPIPETIFVLSNGERLESNRYTIGALYLRVEVGGEERTIAVAELDRKATMAANQGRGVDLKIPTNGSEVFVAF